MELEVFVHGALCMAYSGRCLLSGYINKRDPNQGACTNACRWSYQSHEAQADEVGQYRPVDAELPEPVLVEEQGSLIGMALFMTRGLQSLRHPIFLVNYLKFLMKTLIILLNLSL